ncbi:tetratricopeptide repeat protein [Streptomyces sp. NPDC127036]|uniref:tetratricopeptide repeat protein n=1 Tax=Streptomyces sp. NPDC127036 TaxID=3347112 RepID=UPI00364846DE
MHFSERWLPPENAGDAEEESDDEVGAVIRAALVDLQVGVIEGDSSRCAAARDGLASAIGLLEDGDRRLAWVLCFLAEIYLMWPGASDRRNMLDLAVQYGDAAAEAVLGDVAGRKSVVVTAALARLGRYLQTDSSEDILAATQYTQRLLPVSPNETGAAMVFASVHLSLYDHTSDAGALDMATAISRSVIGPERTMAIGFEELHLVANVLERTDARRHEPGLLVEAGHLPELALSFAHNPEARSTGLTSLSDCRRALYWMGGNPADLERAIQAASEATQLHQRDAFRDTAATVSLALGLRARFEAFGGLDDLNETIQLFRSVNCEMATPNSYELSVALRLRYEAIGSLPDLVEALQLAEHNALGDGASTIDLIQYSMLLKHAFERSGDVSTLSTAIEVARRGVARTRRGQAGAELVHNTLVLCLLSAHGREPEPGLLDEAIEASETAFALAAPDAPRTTSIQINRASAYQLRWEERGSPDDLEVALAAVTDVLARTGADHPDRAGRLRMFAKIADALGRVHGDPSARARALAARDEAVRSTTAPPDSRIRAAVAAGESLAEDGRWQEANARFAIAVSLMPEVAWHGLDRTSQEHHLREGADLPALAAAHALQADDTVGAIARLEIGRSVMWQHLLRLSDPSAVGDDSEAAGIVAELRRAVEVEGLFREWSGSEDSADQMPREQVEELAADLGLLREPGAAAVVLGTLALRLRRTGDAPTAIAVYLEAIELAEAADDLLTLGELHGNLGFAYRQIGDQDLGIRHYRHSVEILKDTGPADVVGRARNNLGLALCGMGGYEEGAAELAAAASNFAGADSRCQAASLHDLALALAELDRLEDAMSAVRQSRKLFVELGDRRGQAHAWYSEGLIHDRADRTELAIEALETSWGLYGLEDPERSEIEADLEMLRAG